MPVLISILLLENKDLQNLLAYEIDNFAKFYLKYLLTEFRVVYICVLYLLNIIIYKDKRLCFYRVTVFNDFI